MKFQRIQDLRTDADLSQRELSEILHISQRSYSHYETGSRNIPIEMLIRLANYYDTSIDYLVGRTDRKKMIKERNPRNLKQFGKFLYQDSLTVTDPGILYLFSIICFFFAIRDSIYTCVILGRSIFTFTVICIRIRSIFSISTVYFCR